MSAVRKRKQAKRAEAKKALEFKFESQTWTEAKMSFEGAKKMSNEENDYLNNRLHTDKYNKAGSISTNRFGSLVGTAPCGEEFYICHQDDIPTLAAFLNKIVEANTASATK